MQYVLGSLGYFSLNITVERQKQLVASAIVRCCKPSGAINTTTFDASNLPHEDEEVHHVAGETVTICL